MNFIMIPFVIIAMPVAMLVVGYEVAKEAIKEALDQ